MSATIIDYQDTAVEVHRLVVGPVDNNVYIVRCRSTGESLLIDAANEHDKLLELCSALECAPGGRDPWALGPHPGGGGRPGRGHRRRRDQLRTPTCCPPTTSSSRTARYSRWVGSASRTIATPGHTPGSMCFTVEGTPLLFSGDTLFPGGPGNTSFENADFATIIRSIEDRLFSPFAPETMVLPGHGAGTTIGAETPHLEEWIERGW